MIKVKVSEQKQKRGEVRRLVAETECKRPVRDQEVVKCDLSLANEVVSAIGVPVSHSYGEGSVLI